MVQQKSSYPISVIFQPFNIFMMRLQTYLVRTANGKLNNLVILYVGSDLVQLIQFCLKLLDEDQRYLFQLVP